MFCRLDVSAIRRLHRAGVRITDLVLAKEHPDFLGAIRNYFRGLPEARRAANIPEPAPIIPKERQRWDESRVITEIEELDRSGESVAASKVPNPLLKAGKRYFASWTNALEASGLDPEKNSLVGRAYDEEELLGILRATAREVPEMRFTELYDQSFYPAIVRLFGDVETALSRANIRDWPVRQRGATTTTMIVARRRIRSRTGIIRAACDGRPPRAVAR